MPERLGRLLQKMKENLRNALHIIGIKQVKYKLEFSYAYNLEDNGDESSL